MCAADLSGHRSGSYGALVDALLSAPPLNELGPGQPNRAARERLGALTPESLVAPAVLHDREMAQACCAALWLRHDYLDESHEISQQLDSPEGSYWHGIMHRREPDFGNARYWMRLTGTHAIHGSLLKAAQELASSGKPDPAARFLLESKSWDPSQFVGLCEEALDGSPPLHSLVKKIQLAEWELLFDYCFRAAAGT
jgi:hypothetical protein